MGCLFRPEGRREALAGAASPESPGKPPDSRPESWIRAVQTFGSVRGAELRRAGKMGNLGQPGEGHAVPEGVLLRLARWRRMCAGGLGQACALVQRGARGALATHRTLPLEADLRGPPTFPQHSHTSSDSLESY